MKHLLALTAVLALGLTGAIAQTCPNGGGGCSGKKGDKKEAPKDTVVRTINF